MEYTEYDKKLDKKITKSTEYNLLSVWMKNHLPARDDFIYQKTVVLTKKEKLTAVNQWLKDHNGKHKTAELWKMALLRFLKGLFNE